MKNVTYEGYKLSRMIKKLSFTIFLLAFGLMLGSFSFMYHVHVTNKVFDAFAEAQAKLFDYYITDCMPKAKDQ